MHARMHAGRAAHRPVVKVERVHETAEELPVTHDPIEHLSNENIVERVGYLQLLELLVRVRVQGDLCWVVRPVNLLGDLKQLLWPHGLGVVSLLRAVAVVRGARGPRGALAAITMFV